MTYLGRNFKNRRQKTQDEANAENLANALSSLLGTKVVSGFDFDKVNNENQQLLEKAKDIDKIKKKLLSTQCKLYAFIKYHNQWKPTTRKFENRLKKLHAEDLYQELDNYPADISDNLKEAYKCYINGLPMACYIMTLRAMEITINILYEKHNPIQYDEKGKTKFVSAMNKLNWTKNQKLVGGFDYTLAKSFIESRNDAIHEVFVPSEKQIMSAIETVLNLMEKLKPNL